MKIETVTDIKRFRELEPEWNAALGSSQSNNPFSTFEWLTSWLDVFGGQTHLYTIVVWDNGHLAAMAPLTVNEKGYLVFIGYPLNDYADFVVAEGHQEALDAILDHLLQVRGIWKKAVLDQLPEGCSQANNIIEHLRQHNRPHRVISSDTCPAMVLDDPQAARKTYYKRNITTYINTFKKQGELKYNIYTDQNEAFQRLDDLFSQHIERRDRTPFPSQFTNEAIRKFFKTFMARMHPEGWVQFSSLTLNNEFLALYISFEYNKVLYLYTTSFNVRYAKWSPGQVILRYLFDYAIERQIKQLDFARGDESYKDRFSNVFKQNRKIIIYRRRLSRVCADAFHSFRYSRVVNLLYRNARVQAMRATFLYHLRVNGLVTAVKKGLAELFRAPRKIEKQA